MTSQKHVILHPPDPPDKEVYRGYVENVLIPELVQMMFVAGETGEPSQETLWLVEQIVHEQVQEMVC